MKNIGTIFSIALTTSMLIGGISANSQTSNFSSVTGTITYRERIALPPNALVIVDIQDVSQPKNTPPTVIGRKTIGNSTNVPIPFEITYDTRTINPSRTYAIDARIIVDNQVRFRNTTAYPVITQGKPNKVEVVLQPVK